MCGLRLGNVGEYLYFGFQRLRRCPTVLPFRIEVGQLQPPKLVPLPYCPTFFIFLSCIEGKLKTRVRATGANTCPLRLCVRDVGEGWTVGHPSNDGACACPTAVNDSKTRSDGWTLVDGSTATVMQPSPLTGPQCTHAPHAGADSRYRGYSHSGCISATESSPDCSNAPARPPPTAAASAC
jgi:hypothetical protein